MESGKWRESFGRRFNHLIYPFFYGFPFINTDNDVKWFFKINFLEKRQGFYDNRRISCLVFLLICVDHLVEGKIRRQLCNINKILQPGPIANYGIKFHCGNILKACKTNTLYQEFQCAGCDCFFM